MNRPFFLLAVPLLTLGSQAQADFYSHRYAGVSYSDVELQGFCSDAAKFVQRLDSGDQRATNGTCGESGDGWKVYSGWRWTPHLAVEASYQQLADADLNFRLDYPFGEFVNASESTETQLANAFVVGHWPLLDGLSLHGKLGGGLWFSTLKTRVTGELFTPVGITENDELIVELRPFRSRASTSDNGFHWGYGAGISYRYQNSWTIRAEWETFSDISSDDLRGEFDVEAASLGWSMHF